MKYSIIKRFSFALFSLALLAIMPSLSYGQWILGFKAGYGSAKITGADVYGGMNNKSGADIGLIISKKLKVDFAFESGIFYTQSGVNHKFIQVKKVSYNDPSTGNRISSDSTFRYDNNISLNYLKIPLMLRKSFSIKGSNLYPYRRKISITDIDIMVGPYVGYLLSSSATFDTKVSVINKDNELTTSTEPEKALTDKYHRSFQIGSIDTALALNGITVPTPSVSSGLNKLDVGIQAALGLSIELSPNTKFMFGCNYSMGLLTIDKTYFNKVSLVIDGNGTPTKSVKKMDLKNSNLGFYLAYVMYLK